MDYLATVKELHRCRIEPVTGPPRGALAAEVAQLESAVGSPLPAAYSQFLLWIGNDRDGVYRGTDIFISDVLANTDALPELLADNGVVPPSRRFLCFESHQGYFMAWFELPNPSEDPEVLYFGEGRGMTEPQTGGSFTSYIAAELADLAALCGNARSTKPRLLSRVMSWFGRSRTTG